MEREKQISLASNNITEIYNKNSTLQIMLCKRLTLRKASGQAERRFLFVCFVLFVLYALVSLLFIIL